MNNQEQNKIEQPSQDEKDKTNIQSITSSAEI